VLANLLDNAVKYSPPGSEVTVTVSGDDTTVTLAVEDEGPGIAAGERELVFESFYRGESRVQLRTRGLGIGLAVVRALTDAMGGSVRAEEGRGGGACLVVVLRRA
jgi:two-component system sensor histidine kinase KdpD